MQRIARPDVLGILAMVLLLLFAVSDSRAQARSATSGGMNAGEVSLIRVAARKAGLRDFKMISRLAPSGRLIIDGFTATLGGGQIRGSGQVDFARSAGPHRMKVEMSDVDAMAFLHLLEVKFDGTVDAKVNGAFDLTWSGTTGSEARRTLSGAAQWSTGQGSVSDADVLRKAAQVTGIADLSRIQISTAGASGTFTEGILDVRSLRVTGPDQEVRGSGQLNVSSRDVRVALQLRVAPELVEKSTRPEIQRLARLVKMTRKAPASSDSQRSRLVTLPLPILMTGKVQDPKFQFGDPSVLDNARQTPPSESSSR